MQKKALFGLTFFIILSFVFYKVIGGAKDVLPINSEANMPDAHAKSKEIKNPELNPGSIENPKDVNKNNTSTENKVTQEVGASPYLSPYSRPHELYSKYIETAEEENPESQFYVHLALEQCQGSAKSYEKLLEAMDVVPEAAVRMEKRFNKCEGLRDIIGKNNQYNQKSIKALSAMWLEKAELNEYPIAVAHERIMQHSSQYTMEEKLSSLQKAIVSERYESYMIASSYYININVDIAKARAWEAAACIYNDACSIERYMDEIPLSADPANYKRMEDTLKEIKTAISNKTWDKLDIFKN